MKTLHQFINTRAHENNQGAGLLLNLSSSCRKMSLISLLLRALLILPILLPVSYVKGQHEQVSSDDLITSIFWSEGSIRKVSHLSTINSISSYTFTEPGYMAMLIVDDPSIVVYQTGKDGELINTIPLPEVPLVFAYRSGFYYVVGFNHLYILDNEGKILNKTEYTLPEGHNFAIESLVLAEDGTPVLNLADGSSWDILKTGLEERSNQLWAFSSNYSAMTERVSDQSFRFVVEGSDAYAEQTIGLSLKSGYSLSSVKLIQVQDNLVWLDIETTSFSNTQRYIYAVTFEGVVKTIVEIPLVYSTYIPQQFAAYETGISYALSAKDGIRFYAIQDKTERIQFDHDNGLHFNDLLPANTIEVDSSDNDTGMSPKAQITREQIIANGMAYVNHSWTARAANIWNNVSCGGKTIKTPSWVVVGSNTSTPYCWGGNSSIADFNAYLLQNKSAGDMNTATSYGAEPNCSVGVDCSGFVSRSFGLSTHYGTSNLSSITTVLPSFNSLQPGDILLKAGHVMLFHSFSANGSINVIESVSGYWKVKNSNYTVSALSGYTPRMYNDVINGGLKLNSAISVNPNPIVQNQSVTVSVSLKNTSNQNFSGSIAAALHSTNGSFLGDIELKNNVSISANGTKSLSFTKSQITSNPGNYKIYLKSKPNGGTWSDIAPGNYTNPINITIVGGACNAPTGVYASNVSKTSARINWNIVANAQNIKLQYRKSTTSTWTTLTLPGNYYYKVLTGLTKNTKYYVRLQTVCSSGTSSYSNTISFTTTNSKGPDREEPILSEEEMELHVFPNPAQDVVNIKLIPANEEYHSQVIITNAIGNVMIETSFDRYETSIPVGYLAKGVYFVKVITGKQEFFRKLVLR